MRINRIRATITAGLLLLMLILPQLALAAGPSMSIPVVLGTTSTTANIYWTTNTSSDSWVYYRLEGATTWAHVHDSTEVTTHFIGLTGLQSGKTYYFWIQSTDTSGTSTDDNDGNYYHFTTGPPQYSITLDSVCGVCGELIDVDTCGEVIGVTATVAMAGTYHICWDSLTNAKATFAASGAGIYTLTFFMPEAYKGEHNVYLTDNAYDEKAKATFEVFPSVKIDPEEGPVGTTVTLDGYGFPASKEIKVTLFQGEIKKGEEEKDTADAKGTWGPISYTIPDTPAGGYTFDIAANEGTPVGWVNWVSKYFEVTPKITATPSSGTVGQTIKVEGTGFKSEEEDIEVTFDGEVVKPSTYPDVDENGSWSVVIAVPPLRSGTYAIDASGMLTRARDVPDVEFILSPGIWVEPGLAYVGDTITVTGGGFEPEETGIKVYFEGTVVATGITARKEGSWETSFALPTSTFGGHTVSASGDITKPAVTTTLNTKAKIEDLSPVEGSPGDSVTLRGSGFSGNKKLTVTVGGIEVPEDMRTQANGNFVIPFHVPKGSTVGERTLVVTDEGGATNSTAFTVTKKTLSTTPLPISPKDSTLRSGAVTFKWQGVTGDTGYTYTLEIVDHWSKSGIAESSYTLTDTETLPKGTYYWRVKMVDDYGNESAWSDSSKFKVSPIPTWVWVVVGVVVLIGLMVVAYRETKFKVTE